LSLLPILVSTPDQPKPCQRVEVACATISLPDRVTLLLKEWPEPGPPLVWQVEGLGTGFGGPSVTGDKIFVMGRRDGKDHIIAMNATDGSILCTSATRKS
jgi:hypothetical protein